MAWNAMRIVCSDEAQKRFRVHAGTWWSKPASSAALRPTLEPWSPPPPPAPIITSFVSAKSTSGFRSVRALSGIAARSSARTSLSEPLTARPIGVRTASTMTASGISGVLSLCEPLAEQLRVGGDVAGVVGEVGRLERLRAVAQRDLGVLVDLDDDAVGADRRGGSAEPLHEAAVAGGVARVDDHRQVGVQLQPRHGAEVEREARGGLERANAALAQHDVLIALL